LESVLKMEDTEIDMREKIEKKIINGLSNS